MARELTEQETMELSRIREQMSSAARNMAEAIRTRQQLETRLREVQREMASPDGIANSLLFVEEVNGLRGQIQIARQHEQEADTKRSRLSAEEFLLLSLVTGRTRHATVSSQPSATTSVLLKSGLDGLGNAQSQYARSSEARTALEQTLANNIKKSMLIIFISALVVAAIADILSIFDAGWVVSWAIPMIVWFLVRRVTSINKAGDAIVAAHKSAKRQLTILQQRLRPALRASGNAQLISSRVGDMSFVARSYVSTFIRDTVITQLVELIPILDWLPLYMGQVVKVFIDQNIAYQKVRTLVPQLRYVHQQIDLLEQFEIQFTARQIATVVQAQQGMDSRQQASPSQPIQVPATTSLIPGYAT